MKETVGVGTRKAYPSNFPSISGITNFNARAAPVEVGTIFLPAALWSDGLRVELIEGNLEYKTRLIYEGVVSRPALRAFYALIVITALLASSHRPIQIFGALILVSVVATYLLFPHAFISVWCYFAAVLSAYMVGLATWLRRERRPAFGPASEH